MTCTDQGCEKQATKVRPSPGHLSGSLAAQQVCDEAAERYDKMIADRQQSYREQRKKDLEKRHHSA